MELNKSYDINIIGVNESLGYLVAVEKFNNDASKYYQHYYKKLLNFNNCGEWLKNLEYGDIEIGNVIIVQTNKFTNLWSRGIVVTADKCMTVPKIYLIDSQIFCDNESRLEMRMCPSKLLNLKLPTYHINVNICLDDESIKNAIEILIYKNQCNELSFRFIPQSIHNNVYSGELIVKNNTIDNSFVPLKKFLKNVHRNKYFLDISNKEQYIKFNVLKLKKLENIFIPRDLDGVNGTESVIENDIITNQNISKENLNGINETESVIENDIITNQNVSKENVNGINETESVIENDIITNRNVSKGNLNIKSSMEKQFDCLSISSKLNDTEYQENNSIMTQQILEINNLPPKIEKKSQPVNSLSADSNIWWSSDDDNDENER